MVASETSSAYQVPARGAFVLLLVLAIALACVPHTTAAESSTNAPRVTLAAGPEWVALQPELDIQPGSALDFSTMQFSGAPAGKHGRVIARGDRQFVFEDSPKTARRFYGVNLCFGAHYVPKPEADRLAERLYRLGYNALRIHHYERELVQGQAESTTLNPSKLDQLDYLLAALIRRGIFLTTDLYVSRPVPWREAGFDRDGQIPMDTFKVLVPVHEGAYENWKKFARNFLGHVNPYTQRKYADEPALAWIALINEGNFGNFFKDIRTFPEWARAWNRWLSSRYSSRADLARVWGTELKDSEDAAQGSVALPENIHGQGLRTRDCIAFLGDTEREMVLRMKGFLRNELGCKALISNSSSWTRFTTDQGARQVYDYVDDHFYVDHPQFIERSWQLPSKCPNTSPLAAGANGGRSITFTRLFDKPFTVTEYNYSGPGRFRAVGGILTGAMGALQGWGGIWRFAYSHSANAMFQPSRMGYFDVASDPLSQAAERASLCLFLRGDLQTAPDSVALVMTEADLAKPASRIPTLAPKWDWLAWVTKVGTQVVPGPESALKHTAFLPLGWATPASAYKGRGALQLQPYSLENNSLLAALDAANFQIKGQKPNPVTKFFQSQTGELAIDGPGDRLVLDTERTAGGYAPAGASLSAMKSGLKVRVTGSDATLWVSALDKNPIRRSNRLLVTHLTDLQNSGIQYAETARQTLLDWGSMPHLVRAGEAEVSVALRSPHKFHVWALSPGGRRLVEIPARIESGSLVFTASVASDLSSGARMLYEIAKE